MHIEAKLSELGLVLPAAMIIFAKLFQWENVAGETKFHPLMSAMGR